MIRAQHSLVATLLWAVGMMSSTATATAGTVPWWDSFETYTNGTDVSGTNGWMGATGAGVVTTDSTVTAILPNYAGSYPLAWTNHASVLQLTDVASNAVRSVVTGGVVTVDFMVLPTWVATPPAGDTNMQCNFCISTNARLTVWHCNTAGASPTNEWRELANSPHIDTNVWARFTIVSDYSNLMFQVRVNEQSPVTDSAGWTSATGTLGGAWFHMVQTNRALAGLRMEGAPAYLDDLLVTNRTLTWSGSGFVESSLNNGAVATNPAFTITLADDTFNGANNANLIATGAATATNVPAGLTAVVTRASASQVTVTFAGAAAQHESANSISNFTLRFTDAAFGFGSAWDVGGNQQTNLAVAFANTPRLAWSTNAFRETAANDGSIDNTNPLLITLTNGTFNLTLGADFGADTSKITFTNLPPGLTVEAILTNATQVSLRFMNKAAANAAANSLSNLGVSFQNGAFVTVPASSVFNVGTNLAITFTDPGALTYATNVFWETAANNGAVGGTTLALSNKTFNATNNEDLVASLKVTGANVPGGLTLHVVVTGPQQATLSFTGNATNHTAAYNVSNLGVTFADAAFTGSNSTAVANAARSDLAVRFYDQPWLAAAALTFNEAPANNGSIGNTLTVQLTGDTFTSTGFTAGVQYTVTNVPAGLTFGLTLADTTHVTASLTNRATAHTAAANIANLELTFLNAAFTTVAATNITGHPIDFAVAFSNQPVLTYSTNVFNEISGGAIDNRNPITITLTGDTFAGADGQDFVGAHLLTVANLPGGLTAKATRNSATQLSLTLTGLAVNNASTDSVGNVTATFQAGAFTTVDADQVTHYSKPDLAVVFVDDPGFYNIIPYEEPFEVYANGTGMNGMYGWTTVWDPNGATIVNDPALSTAELAYLQQHASLPVNGNHTQVLSVQSTALDAIHSATGALVYVDFMTFPTPLLCDPPILTNLQSAFYVSTNGQLVIWHCNVTVEPPTNEWLTLSSEPAIDTSRWMRVTIAQDYSRNLFQVQVNEGRPATNAVGWTQDGLSRPGSWFHMVQTNGCLSGFIMSGGGQGYLDDMTVRTSLSSQFGCRFGSVFTLR